MTLCPVLFSVGDQRWQQVSRALEPEWTWRDARQSKGTEDVWAGRVVGAVSAERSTWAQCQVDWGAGTRGAAGQPGYL